MSIDVTCPNGHQLKLKDKYAGQKGRCPKCNAVIEVPVHVAVMEQELVDLLGPPTARDGAAVHQDPAQAAWKGSGGSGSGSSLMGSSVSPMRHMKTCPSCLREVAMGYHLCPHCHTYFRNADEIRRRG